MIIPLEFEQQERFFLPNHIFKSETPLGWGLFNDKNQLRYLICGHKWMTNNQSHLTLFTELKKESTPNRNEELTLQKAGWTIGVITLSDKGASEKRQDESGPLILEMLSTVLNPVLTRAYLLPDDKNTLKALLSELAGIEYCNLVITTGGTGVAERDITPQVTNHLLDIPLPGFVNAMLMASLTRTKHAIISRAAAGLINKTLVINLPGSKKAARENLEAILPALAHALDKINGDTSDCGAN